MNICIENDCDRPVKYAGLGLCQRCYQRNDRAASPEKYKAWGRANRDKNREVLREYNRQWKANNPDKIKQHQKNRDINDPDRAKRWYNSGGKERQQAKHEKLMASPKNSFMQPAPTDETSYMGAHARVRYYRARASAYVCICDEQAQEWAWSNEVNEYTRYESLPSHYRAGTEVGYSLNIWDYVPLCKSCHVKLDRKLISVSTKDEPVLVS